MLPVVTEASIAPGTAKLGLRHCTWCRQPVGTQHTAECPSIRRKAKVQMTITYEVDILGAAGSDPQGSFEFQRNEGSWCSSNALAELESLSKEKGCLCDTDIEFKFVEWTEDGLRGNGSEAV